MEILYSNRTIILFMLLSYKRISILQYYSLFQYSGEIEKPNTNSCWASLLAYTVLSICSTYTGSYILIYMVDDVHKQKCAVYIQCTLIYC